MILIADSGSTKTDWCVARDGYEVARVTTQGINPFFLSDDDIAAIVRGELLPALPAADGLQDVFFYGAGIREEMRERMSRVLGNALGVGHVEAESDLLGAARALFGHEEGIACILGTGSNSGLYDGSRIVRNTPPLGFILGDEGSGAVLGKQFLGALCKGLLPPALLDDFLSSTGLTVGGIIQAVYREPLPNRFLAGTTRYIHAHLHVPEVCDLVTGSFRDFFRRNLVQYGRSDLEVCFVGSIAHYFSAPLREAAALEGFRVGRIVQRPLEGLLAYHR